MKALYCPHCGDLVTLRHKTRRCECGKCEGRYVGGKNDPRATVRGPQVQVIGIDNHQLRIALGTTLAMDVVPDKGDYDYRLWYLHFPAWFYGPNALKTTRDTRRGKAPDKP